MKTYPGYFLDISKLRILEIFFQYVQEISRFKYNNVEQIDLTKMAKNIWWDYFL